MFSTESMPWMTPADMQHQWQQFTERMAAMPKVMEIARKTRVGTTPTDVVFRDGKVKLLRYRPLVETKYATPLVVAFALVNRPYILDLKPGKSVVQHYLNAGFDVYNIDWGIPTQADKHLDMHDYINGYMDRAVDFVRERSGQDQINLLGYCMGGTMSAIYTALQQEKIKNLTLMAAPTDWSRKDHLLARWTDADAFDVDRIIDVYGNAPPELLQGSFMLLKPVSTLVEKYFSFYDNMENEKFLEDFFAMETWLNDNIPVAGEMFRQFVKLLMQEDRLLQGGLEIGGECVDVSNITCPLLSLTAEHDHLVPCNQSSALHAQVSSQDTRLVTFPAGHIGLAVGSKANRDLWPQAAAWLGERSATV